MKALLGSTVNRSNDLFCQTKHIDSRRTCVETCASMDKLSPVKPVDEMHVRVAIMVIYDSCAVFVLCLYSCFIHQSGLKAHVNVYCNSRLCRSKKTTHTSRIAVVDVVFDVAGCVRRCLCWILFFDFVTPQYICPSAVGTANTVHGKLTRSIFSSGKSYECHRCVYVSVQKNKIKFIFIMKIQIERNSKENQ